MNWLAPENGMQASEGGYRVTAVRVANGWRFSAWSPPALPELNYWKWREQADMRIAYPVGCQVPQRVRLLGVFANGADARAICEADAHE